MISLRRGAQDALAAIEIDREARRLQRQADAALVEAAGCPCYHLARWEDLEGDVSDGPVFSWGVELDYRTNPPVVVKHAACCPSAQAANIRSGG